MVKNLVCIKAEMRRVSMQTMPLPALAAGQALLRTRLSTICGSDIHIVDEMPVPPGTPMGHEAVGEIVDAGAGVTSFKQGQRVMASCFMSCGACARCREGNAQICETFMVPMNLLFGAQAQYYVIPNAETNLTAIPDELEDEQVLFATDIMSTAFGAIENAELRYGDSVAIFAQGPVGLCVTAAARARGAGLIVAVEAIPERAALARRLGADVVCAPERAVDEIRARTGGRGVDVAVEAFGSQVTLDNACQVTRWGGVVSSVGVYGAYPTVTIATGGTFLHRRFVSTLCPSGPERLRRMMDVIRYGRVDLRPLLTHSMKIADTPAAYDLFRSRSDGVVKIALRP